MAIALWFVSIMQFISQHTAIPIPKILGFGQCVVGPYIVMTFAEGNPMSGYLRDPSQQDVTLGPNIPMSVLRTAFFGMSEVLLELSKPTFPFIGAIKQDALGQWTVQKGPVTFNMNRLAQFSNIPHIFSRGRFGNAADYFEELARHQFYHLKLQRNDAITNEADCRTKYIARCLFRKLSRQISEEHCIAPFRLYCDDLRPCNVLVDTSRLIVTGVVDWEFTYAAPVEFTMTAPWWLLLENQRTGSLISSIFYCVLCRDFAISLRFSKIVRPEKFKTALCHNPKDYRSLWRGH